MPPADDLNKIEEGRLGENGRDQNPMRKFWNVLFSGKAAAWAAFSAVVMMVFTGLLWRVNDRANETSVAAQRAFITHSGVAGMIKVVESNQFKGVNVFFALTNSGTTPAKEAVAQWNIALGDKTPEEGTNFGELPTSETYRFVLGPKANMQPKPIFISLGELEEVERGKKHLFFWGWTTYKDIFDGTPRRLSEYCYSISSLTFSKPEHTDIATEIQTVNPPCPTHNCYDENCEDYSSRTQQR
jgi:hypothetical protein